jgi:ATP-dependent helicase HepA
VLVNVRDLAEFGVGKLNGFDPEGRPIIYFSSEGRKVLSARSSLVRVTLGPGTLVRCKLPHRDGPVEGVVTAATEPLPSGHYVYRVRIEGEDVAVAEQNLLPLLAGTDPLQSLKAFRWDAPAYYFARWAMADLMARWFTASGGFPALMGARVRPLGHQLYAARRVLLDSRPRFILADEVGLGKTIEAGLVIQALQAEKSAMTILILAPGSMSRQWLTEFYLRFGARAYTHVDARRLDNLTARERKDLLTQQRMIVATTALEDDPPLGEVLAERTWDMIVIDEAHQFPPGSHLYGLFQRLAARSIGLLLLSATPSKRDVQGLAGLLALIAPEAYRPTDGEALQRRVDMQSHLWDRLNFTSRMIESTAAEGRGLDADELAFVADEWAGLLDGDPVVGVMVERMRAGDAKAAAELVAYVQEFHRLDHRIVRTRRATLRQPDLQWASRTVSVLPYEAAPEEGMLLGHLDELPAAADPAGTALRCLYHRFCSSTAANAVRFLKARAGMLRGGIDASGSGDPLDVLMSDPGPADEGLVLTRLIASVPRLQGEAAWLKVAMPLAQAWRDRGYGTGRLAEVTRWLRAHLAENDQNQVLLFAQDHAAAVEIAANLREALGQERVAAFHYGLPEEELAAVAFRFQHDPRCRVLVSDELGGEGRNFQNASAVLHFDLPLSPARLEQRIGRLDRVGRDASRPVHSVVVEGAARVERALLEVQHDVFRVFERTIGGLEFVLPRLQRRLAEAYGNGSEALQRAMPDLAAEVRAALDAADEAFDLSLDATKPHLDAAIALATAVGDSVAADEAAKVVRRWASRLGLTMKEPKPGVCEVVWTNADLRVPIPALKVGDGAPEARRYICGTFERERALSHENLQFFAPGHDLVDALHDQVRHGGHGRATAFLLTGYPNNKGTVLLQILARSVIDESLWPSGGIDAGLAARARAVLWPEVLAEAMLVWDGKGPRCALLTHAGLRGLLDHPRDDLKLRPLRPSEVTSLPILSELWKAVDAAVPLGLKSIGERRSPFAAERAQQLEDSLRNEIGFLSWQASRRAAADAEKAIHARRRLVESVRAARVELLSLALVVLS